MRILLFSSHYPPDVAATGQLVAELAEDPGMLLAWV